MPEPKFPKVIWHQCGVNAAGEPFVQLLLDDQVVTQFSPAEAREFGVKFMEVAEAAEQDAFLVHFARTALGADDNVASSILIAYRKFRESGGKKGGPTSRSEFMQTDRHEKPPKP